MFKLLFGLGFVIAPLYNLYRFSRNRRSENVKGEAQPLFTFAPKLTVVTHISIPVLSNNGEDVGKLVDGLDDRAKVAIREPIRQKLSKQPDEYLKNGSNGGALRRAGLLNANGGNDCDLVITGYKKRKIWQRC